MSRRPFLAACAALSLLLVGTGCAGQAASGRAADDAPPMTLSDFYGFCSALPTPNACVSDPICQGYRAALEHAPAALADCLALCRSLENTRYDANLVNGCEGVLDNAQALCDQFCRRRDRERTQPAP